MLNPNHVDHPNGKYRDTVNQQAKYKEKARMS